MLLNSLPRKIRSLYNRVRGRQVLIFCVPNDDRGTRTLYVVTKSRKSKPLAIVVDREDSLAAVALRRAGFSDWPIGLDFPVTNEWCDRYLRSMSEQEVPIHGLGLNCGLS